MGRFLRSGGVSGILVAALEEYAEARIFMHFRETQALLPFRSLKWVRVEEFLGGLMDCTGELNRYAGVLLTSASGLAVLKTEYVKTGALSCQNDFLLKVKLGYEFRRVLCRFAVLRATEGDEEAVRSCVEFVGAVHEKMLLMDLRNSPLRRKYDAIKYTQKRLEALSYELAFARRMHDLKLPSMMMEPEPEIAAEQEES